MTTTVAAHPRWHLSVPAWVTAIACAGVAAVVGALGLVPRLPEPADAPLWSSTTAVLVFVLATTVAEVVRVPLLHDGAVEDLTFFEIVTVAALLLLAPQWALVAPLAGLAIAQAVSRKPWVKVVFNLGSYAVATSAALVTYLFVAGPAPQFSLRSTGGLLAGMAAFAVINTVFLAVILHEAQGSAIHSVITDFWALPVLMTVASISVGAIAVAVAPSSPSLVPFTLLPAVALWYAYRSAGQRAAERERNAWLVTLSGELTQDRPLEELIATASASVCAAFGADVIEVVLPENGSVRYQTLLCDVPLALPDALLPQGWSTGVVVALELGSGRRGALLLGSRHDAAHAWALSASDSPVLTTVATSLASAIRSTQHRQALDTEARKFKAVVEHATDGIAVLSDTGEVHHWSRALARITGVSAHDAQGSTTPAEAVLAPLRELVRERVVLDGPADVARHGSVELTLIRPDGESRDLSVSTVRADASEYGEGLSILTIHDITSQARADRLKADFVATISHELRTPLTPIKGYAQLLRAKGDAMTPERRAAALDLIAERADHMGRLVEDLLMASRASGTLGSKLSTAPAPHDLRDIVSGAASNFPTLGSRLTVESPDDVVPVFCDEVRTVQILSNLLANAAKYSPDDTPIVIRVRPTEFGDSHARVEIVDHGNGISADDLDRVFERFYRVEDSMTMRTSGSGLGLYIARELAAVMDGDLQVVSALGTGSTFTLSLPRCPVASSDMHVPSPRIALESA